jgi:ketose-bisphosphate aldolase
MPIAHLRDILAAAERAGQAVCYCESWNLESLQAVIEASEELHAPAVVGFNGGFLRHRSRVKAESLAYYAGFRKALERASVPVAFLLNESDSLDQIREAIDLGFNAVMPENEGLELEEYRELVKAVVAIARPKSIWVEAQIGTLPSGAGHHNGSGSLTDPDIAAEFVADTGIDALAVSVGNVHILTEGKASLNLESLRAIRERIRIPLVVHGGTSITDEDLREVVRLGVSKVNFGTVLKQEYLEAVRAAIAQYRPPLSPHEFLGIGGPRDVMVQGREAVKRKVMDLISICTPRGQQVYDFSTSV